MGLYEYLLKIRVLKSLLLLFLLVFTGAVVGFCQPSSPKFSYLTVDEGLSHTDANDLAQDKQGFIWIATFFGLDRFDGYALKKFYNSNEPVNNAFKNRIICVYPDDDGNIWLGTEGGIQCFDSKTEKYIDYYITGVKPQPTFRKLIKSKDEFIYGLTDDQLSCYSIHGKEIVKRNWNLPAGVGFSDMAAGPSGNLYLSSDRGVWVWSKNSGFHSVGVKNCPEENFVGIYLNKNQNILVATANQLLLTFKEPGPRSPSGSSESCAVRVIKSYTCAPGLIIRGIREDRKGNYWINTRSRLICLDSSLNFIQEVTNKSSQNSLNSSTVSNFYIDRSQCLWACTFGGGVNYCDLNEKKFYTLRINADNLNSLSGNYIGSVLEDKEQKLWIGTKYNGLIQYDLKTGKTIPFNSYKSAVRLKNDDIAALTLDNDQNLWIGGGGGIEILKPDRTNLLSVRGSEKFPDYHIETLARDCYGNIWFGNHMNRFGVIWKDRQSNYQVRYYGEGFFIFPEAQKPELFVSSTHGLKRFVIDKEGNIIKTFDYQAGAGHNTLSSNYTYPVRKQNDSTYWIGTIGGGLNRLILKDNDVYTLQSYTGAAGIFKDVESLEIDAAGHVWMGGNGLQCFDPKTGKLTKYNKSDGLQGNSFKVGSSYKGSDGRLYFGGLNGLNYFYPDEIKSNLISPHPVLTDLLINNQKTSYGSSDSTDTTIPQTLAYCQSLNLSYLQNNFVISFSAMHYANPLSCKYRYKLIGYDNEWKYTDGKNPSAAYSNLDYRNYQFVVQATNNDGVWSIEQAKVRIAIVPPWWKSAWAKLLYATLFVCALLWLYVYQARWYRLKRELAIRAINEKKREEMHQHREELYQQQLQFFTNISHEFRTPLTLILGPLESLINANKDYALNNSYQLMFRNVKRLINLINELMNFKKVADSTITLQLQPLAINEFCKSIYQEFENLALSKDIRFTLLDHVTPENGKPLSNFFDAQVLEKILFNLLNNALKYTNVGGAVRLEIFLDRSTFKPAFATEFQLPAEAPAAGYIYFLIADTGIGISKESIGSIFDRYYRISKNHLGSGVGLALVKSLTRLHKGSISVYSERYKGTEILVALPWGKENYSAKEIVTEPNDAAPSQFERLDHSTLPFTPGNRQDNQQVPKKIARHILLVEDNSELRAFLKQALENYYYVHEAEDGNAAIEIAADNMPDLIISDVMMPGMTGIELCKLVKEKFETSHIPFIILSAKDALDTRIEGLESGADYYFAKPLSIDLLLLTVHNIFEQGQRLKLKYSKDYLTEATELVHSEKDKEFVNKLVELIEANIQDPDLSVDFLCNHLYISRTKLYQKIKSISDQSIGEFIKTMRLKKAIQMMTHEDIPLNEVAYRIGLQSPGYFSRVFKKEFGKSPTEFMQTFKNDSKCDQKLNQ